MLDGNARYLDRPLTPEEKKLQRQIRAKLARLKDGIEREQYGADWVAYRNAEIARRKDKDYLGAYAQFQRIIADYPGTVFSEASECYAIDCLVALCSKTEREKARQAVENANARLKGQLETLREARRARQLPAPALEELAAKARDLEARLRTIEQVPTGPLALTLAVRRAASFLKRDPTGLYRGEVFIVLGRYYLETAFDPARAEQCFSRAAQWCADLPANPRVPPALEIPDKAREVGAAPEYDRVRDAFTNVKVQEPEPGVIVNQHTCSWYVRRLRREALLKGGLIAYVRGNLAQAKKLWSSLYDVDPYFAQEEAQGWGSTVKLLLWTLEHQPGGLYARPEELAAFTDPRLRLAVSIADLAEMNAEYGVAEGKYKALLEAPFWKLTTPQKAYLTFALIRSMDMQFKEKEVEAAAAGYDQQFGNTPTMARFLLWRGNLKTSSLSKVGTPEWNSGMADYAELIRRFPKTIEADCACYYWGWSLYLAKDYDQAAERFEIYQRLYPEGIWKEAAVYYLGGSRRKIPDL